jgi:Ran GTPase-activating protein (RanGAP) involved in mRNA processing and transport
MFYVLLLQLWTTENPAEDQTTGKSEARFSNVTTSSVPLAAINSSDRKENVSHPNLSIVQPTDDKTDEASPSVQEKDGPIPATLSDSDGDHSRSIHTLRTEEVISSGRFRKDIQENGNDVELSSVLNQGEAETPFDLFVETFVKGPLDSELRSSLEKLWTIETSWRNTIRWASMDSILQRLGYLLSINRDGITLVQRFSEFAPLPTEVDAQSSRELEGQFCRIAVLGDSQKKQHCLQPVWLSGGSFPLVSEHNRKLVQLIDGLRQGAEFAIFRGIHLSITALAIYQLYNWLHQVLPLPCQKQTTTSHDLLGLLKFYESSDDNVLLGIFHDVFGSQNSLLSYLRYTLFIPAIWGLGKGGWNTRNSNLSKEKITQCLKAIDDIKPGVYNDVFRWLLPLHPINRKTNTLTKNALLNPEISEQNLQKIINILTGLAAGNRKYTSIHALGCLMSFAYGFNTQDVVRFLGKMPQQEDSPLLDATVSEEQQAQKVKAYIDTRLKLKAKALAAIQDVASFRKDGKRKSCVEHGVSLYAQYLLWLLGSSRSWPEGLFYTTFKGGKLYLQAMFVKKIVEAALVAEQCPQEPGVSLAGVEPWATDLSEQCFNVYVKLFNVIPGQPAVNLTGNLDQYYFPDCSISLDLSNKDLSGEAVYNITKALFNHNLTITHLNLSGNVVRSQFENIFRMMTNLQVLDFSHNGIGAANTVDLGQSLKHLTALTALNFSNDYFGEITNPTDVAAFGDGLQHLKTLTTLHLSNNNIGSTSLVFDVMLGQSFQNLTSLTYLDLAKNNIDAKWTHDTIALAQGLRYLKALRTLVLFDNDIGQIGPNGTIALAESLKNMQKLRTLDLSRNTIGFGNKPIDLSPSGAIALAQSFKYLESLTFLDISENFFGDCLDCNGSQPLAQSLRHLKELTHLDLSDNLLGEAALGLSLQNLTKLTYLDLSYNFIAGFVDSPTSIQGLVDSLVYLQKLKTFKILPPQAVGSSFSNAEIKAINQALNHTQALHVLPLLASPQDVEAYCPTLPTFPQTIDFSARLYNPDGPTMTAFMKCLQSKNSSLKSLDFSGIAGNLNDAIEENAAIALGNGLQYLRDLTYLNLSSTRITNSYLSTIALGESFQYLKVLKTLDLSGNKMDYDNSPVELGQGLKYLANLTYLDLSSNDIGYYSSAFIFALAESFQYLKALTYLDLSTNWFHVKDSNATVALGNSLQNLTALTYLDLSHGWAGDSESVLALAKGLNHTRNLATLNLYHSIGGSETAQAALFSVLPNLPHLNLLTLNLDGMTQVPWTTSAGILLQLRSTSLMTQCQVSRCFGGNIPTSQIAIQAESQQSASSARRHFLQLSMSPEVLPVTSSASAPSSFWREATKRMSSAYRTSLDISDHPDVQMMAWGVAANLAYVGLQTWPLLAGYIAIGGV